MTDTLTSTDPATGEPLDAIPITSPGEVQQAVDHAREAQPAWADRTLRERMSILESFRDDVLEDRLDLARRVTDESGKPYREALVTDVLPTLDMVRALDKHGPRTLKGETTRLENPMLKDRASRVSREPLGVLAIIAPWNYPLAIPATQTLTALYAGNAVVLKPSERTPLLGAKLVDRLHQAGVPEDVLHVVQGAGETGNALVEAGPDKVLFTGSVPVGRDVQKAAAEHGARCALEMGGNDPMLVLDDANLELAARGAVWAAFSNAGQTCAAVERVYVDDSVADRFLDHVVDQTRQLRLGPGSDPDTDVGPLITEQALKRVQEHVEDAVSKGATVEAGGDRREDLGPRFFEPTVLNGATHDMLVMREETFGPLLPIQRVPDEHTALDAANDSRYGLTASVWTTRHDRGDRIADQLEAGVVTINDHAYTYGACETPWSGIKDSGSGVTHGRWGLEEVTRVKHVNRARAGRATSPWYFPYDEDLETMGDEGLELLYGSKVKGLKALPASVRRLFGTDLD